MTYVLTHEYFDKSGFSINGVTDNQRIAETWYVANDENNVYEFYVDDRVLHWMDGRKSWREQRKVSK